MQRDVTKSITDLQKAVQEASALKKKRKQHDTAIVSDQDKHVRIIEIERLMQEAASRLDFETAIALRNEWHMLNK